VARSDLSNRGSGDGQAGVVELVRQLSDDSRRLARDEIRLAKLEMADTLRSGGQGAMVMAVAFGASVIALSALTVCVIAALSLAIGKVWIAALIAGVVELLLGFLLVQRGARDFEGIGHSVADNGPPRHGTKRRGTVRHGATGARTSGRAD
jgi:hypothetical protein